MHAVYVLHSLGVCFLLPVAARVASSLSIRKRVWQGEIHVSCWGHAGIKLM